MKGIAKRIASALVTGALALGGITGCSQGVAAPTTAAELLERYEAAENHDNFHLDLTMNMDVSLFGSTLEMPVTASYDVAGSDSHGTVTMDLSSLVGESITSESYVTMDGTDVIQYANAGDGTWVKSTTDVSNIATSLTSADLFKDAEFKELGTSDAEAYELTISGEQLMGALSELGDTTSMLGQDESTAAMFAESEAHYVFSKDCLPTSLTFALSYSADNDSEYTIDAGVGLDMNATFSGFGTVDAASIAVPQDVATSAVDASALGEDANALLSTVTGNTEVTGTEGGGTTFPDAA